MRVNLKCPFAEKDIAKALGARWDVARKTWFVENPEDLTPFLRWMPDVKAKPSKKKPVRTIAEKMAGRVFVTVGVDYIESTIAPEGLPWEYLDAQDDIKALKAIAQEAW